MREEQRKIVSSALEKFSLEVITSVIENNYFITQVYYNGQEFAMIDFTRKMEFDYKDFCNHSQRLHEHFLFVPKGYGC